MRFRFCGGEDCPDWLLAEISSLAAVSVVKVRQITAEVSELSCRKGWGAIAKLKKKQELLFRFGYNLGELFRDSP